MTDEKHKRIPPGSYTRDTLPEISPEAKAIVERVRKNARLRQSSGETKRLNPQDVATALGGTLVSKYDDGSWDEM